MSGITEIFQEGSTGSLVCAITSAVGKSYDTHPMKRETDAEHKRRFELCVSFVNMARVDLKWSTQRIVDELPRALTAKLNGVEWEAPTRDAWITNG